MPMAFRNAVGMTDPVTPDFNPAIKKISLSSLSEKITPTMQLHTPISIPSSPTPITYAGRLMLFGSCFAENIGEKLAANKFQVDINPFGILYNPLSLKSALTNLLDRRTFTGKDLFEHHGVYHSFAHHSRFSAVDV